MRIFIDNATVLAFITFFNITVSAQNTSNIYNEKCKLYVDTNLSIPKAQYTVWCKAESNLTLLISSIQFPMIYLENNIKAKGNIIASFICDSSDISDIKIESDASGYPGYALAVIDGLKEKSHKIADAIRLTAERNSWKIYKGRYYIPFNFMIIDLDEELKKKHAVPVMRPSIPVIDVGLH